ncbi:MAG: hypothetical protein U1F98_13185 [Verrucomicrobiota bacterium]
MTYLLSLAALSVVGYLVRDFYQEQLRPRMIPVRRDRPTRVRRVRRF